MREIVFRGKKVNDGMWIQGYLFQCWGRAYILWGMTNDTPTMHDVKPETVGQFTGLVDKNGKRIFEGDKIKLTQGIGTVEWSKTQSRFMIWLPKSNKFASFLAGIEYEVIGNIHDNPELPT